MDTHVDEEKTAELKMDSTIMGIKENDVSKAPQNTTTSLSEAIGAGVFAGGFGGLAAHFLAGGNMTLPIFIIVSILFLGHLKGWAKFVALAIFVIVASFIAVLFRYLSQ